MSPIRQLVFVALAVFASGATTVRAQERPARLNLPTTLQSPDEFGIQDYTVTTIGSASFTPQTDDATYGDGYYFVAPWSEAGWGYFSRFETPGYNAGSGHFDATVSIPAGAIIDYIGLETNYYASPGSVNVQLYLVDRYNNITPVAGFSATAAAFHSDYNSSPIGFQLLSNAHNQLVVDIAQADFQYFGWVEIWWKRAVSPPPATPTFNDVPTSDTGFQYVEALAASGVTGGCGGGNFCPDANLTRRQMAIFLAKALGLHWPY